MSLTDGGWQRWPRARRGTRERYPPRTSSEAVHGFALHCTFARSSTLFLASPFQCPSGSPFRAHRHLSGGVSFVPPPFLQPLHQSTCPLGTAGKERCLRRHPSGDALTRPLALGAQDGLVTSGLFLSWHGPPAPRKKASAEPLLFLESCSSGKLVQLLEHPCAERGVGIYKEKEKLP